MTKFLDSIPSFVWFLLGAALAIAFVFERYLTKTEVRLATVLKIETREKNGWDGLFGYGPQYRARLKETMGTKEYSMPISSPEEFREGEYVRVKIKKTCCITHVAVIFDHKVGL